MIPEDELRKNTWIKTISADTAVLSSELATIKEDTPEYKINKILENALNKVKEMREDAKKEGVILEGFSLNLGIPPSLTIDFKFKD